MIIFIFIVLGLCAGTFAIYYEIGLFFDWVNDRLQQRFVRPYCCPKIAHESGVVLACTVDHVEPRRWSMVHANVHHHALWDEDDDRIITERNQ